MLVRPFHLRIRSVEAAGDIELPSRANGLQTRQGVQDFWRDVRGDLLRLQPFPVKIRLSHSLMAESSVTVDKNKCPEAVREIGQHLPMIYIENGQYWWNYPAIKSAINGI